MAPFAFQCSLLSAAVCLFRLTSVCCGIKFGKAAHDREAQLEAQNLLVEKLQEEIEQECTRSNQLQIDLKQLEEKVKVGFSPSEEYSYKVLTL